MLIPFQCKRFVACILLLKQEIYYTVTSITE